MFRYVPDLFVLLVEAQQPGRAYWAPGGLYTPYRVISSSQQGLIRKLIFSDEENEAGERLICLAVQS